MKVGLLYPRSNAHPELMTDFINGLKVALKDPLNGQIQLITESIGFGGNEKEVYDKTEKLLLVEGAELLIAFVDLRILEMLQPLLIQSGKLTIIVNSGANYPVNWTPTPNIVHLTLQHAFMGWLTGIEAATQDQKNSAVATTFYDGGYLHMAAMVNGFEKAGGIITYNYVNNNRYDADFSINPLTDYLMSDKNTVTLLCIFDSTPASLFYSRLNEYSKNNNLHLFVSPMMLEQEALKKMNDGFNFSINGYIPWHTLLESNTNNIFKETIQEQTNKTATVFSLLGWETGLILQEVLSMNNVPHNDGLLLVTQLLKCKINSPRGNLKLDPKTNCFVAPIYKCSIPLGYTHLIMDRVVDYENKWDNFVKIPTEGIVSGWTNTYLCY